MHQNISWAAVQSLTYVFLDISQNSHLSSFIGNRTFQTVLLLLCFPNLSQISLLRFFFQINIASTDLFYDLLDLAIADNIRPDECHCAFFEFCKKKWKRNVKEEKVKLERIVRIERRIVLRRLSVFVFEGKNDDRCAILSTMYKPNF